MALISRLVLQGMLAGFTPQETQFGEIQVRTIDSIAITLLPGCIRTQIGTIHGKYSIQIGMAHRVSLLKPILSKHTLLLSKHTLLLSKHTLLLSKLTLLMSRLATSLLLTGAGARRETGTQR